MSKEKMISEGNVVTEEKGFQMISIDKIMIPESYDMDPNYDTDFLARNIKQNDLISPISVVGPYDKEMYKVVEGARRIQALKAFTESDEIPCYVVKGAIPESKIHQLSVATNCTHRPDDHRLRIEYTKIVYNKWANGQIEKSSMTKEIANATGIRTAQASVYISIYDHISQNGMHDFLNGEIPIDVAYNVSRKARNQDEQNELFKIYEKLPSKSKGIFKKQLKDGKIQEILDSQFYGGVANYIEDSRTKLLTENVMKALMNVYNEENSFDKEDARMIKYLCQDVIDKLDKE